MSSTAEVINSVLRWLNYLLAMPMITLGMLGAIFTIIVFMVQRSFHRSATITYLLAGAIMTAIHLPSIYLQSILVDGFGLRVFNGNDQACAERNYLFYVTTVSAISYPCWAAFDQYVSTHRRASFRHRWSSMHFARWAICGTVVFWAIIYSPMIFLSGTSGGVCILKEGAYRTIHAFVFTPIVFIVGPMILITGFTLGMVRNLRATAFANRHDRLAKQIRRMLIPQLVILAIFGIPFGINSVYNDMTSRMPKDTVRLAIEHLVEQITRLIYHVIFVSTFYIYLYRSSEMRQLIKRTITKHFRPNGVVPLRNSSTKPGTIQGINPTIIFGQKRSAHN